MQILEYHVVPNQVISAANFTQGEVLPTVINETLTVRLDSHCLQNAHAGPISPPFPDSLNSCHSGRPLPKYCPGIDAEHLALRFKKCTKQDGVMAFCRWA